MLSASGICKTVTTAEGPLVLLDNINLAVGSGASLAITGASGSGKSTLLGILAGLDSADAGVVMLDGANLSELDEEGRARLRAASVGFVFQSFQLLPGLTALENVMLPLELQGLSDARARASDLLQQVGLGERLRHRPAQLSGGEQQRVAVARAFANNPPVLFADEPTGNLDARTGAHIIDLLFSLNQQQGTTLVLVTHEQRLAERCSAQLVLEEGRVVSHSAGGRPTYAADVSTGLRFEGAV